MAILLILVALLAIPSAAAAQPANIEECPSFKEKIDLLAGGGASAEMQQARAIALLDVNQMGKCFAFFVANQNRGAAAILKGYISKLEGSRSDKQSGASAGGSGSTSIVAQGPAAKVISLAAEYGALTQSVNGQVITIRGNPSSLIATAIRQDLVPYCIPGLGMDGFCAGNGVLSALRRTSFAFAFNALQPTQAVGTATPGGTSSGTQPVKFDASTSQLASASGRIELWNDRNTDSQGFQDRWKKEIGPRVATAAATLSARADAFVEPIALLKEYTDWRAKFAPRILAASRDRQHLVDEFRTAMAELQPILQKHFPDLGEVAFEALGAYGAYLMEQDAFIDEIAKKNVAALEFTYSRPTSQPHTFNTRFILDWPMSQKDKIVANAAATWYTEKQETGDASEPASFRDAQVGVQYERGLGDLVIVGPAMLSAAFYYQYQHAPALLKVDPLKPIPGVTFVDLPEGAKAVFAEKGDLVLGQVKLSLTPKASSVKVPIAFSLSNRTELIKTGKPLWKVQAGVTYDFDSLFAGK